MNIEQLHFTRTNGDNAGWKFVNITNGVTEEMKQDFQSIHTHTPTNVDMYSFDLVNNKFYLSYSTCTGTDAFGRTKCFIHGLEFPLSNANEIFSEDNYKQLLGFDKFDRDETALISDTIELLGSSYNTDVSGNLDLKNFIECVYEAVLSDKPLYIIDEDEIGI